MKDQKEIFEEFCEKQYGYGCPKSKTVTKSKGERIVQVLKGNHGSHLTPQFKYWVKQRGFKLISYPSLGLKDVLCLPAKTKVSKTAGCNCIVLVFMHLNVVMQNPNDLTMLSEWRRVTYVEDFFDILEEIHCKEKGHVGEKKTIAEVNDMHSLLVYSLAVVQLLLFSPSQTTLHSLIRYQNYMTAYHELHVKSLYSCV